MRIALNSGVVRGYTFRPLGDMPQAFPGSVTLRHSDDGGNTWSIGQTASTGSVGDYGAVVNFNRLGMSKINHNRTYSLHGIGYEVRTINSAYVEVGA